MIVIRVKSAAAALTEAKRRGKRQEFHSRNAHGNPWHFELVGIMDLLELGMECEKDEVWYEIVHRVRPMERKGKLLPPENRLNAIRWERVHKTRVPTNRRKPKL
jgi:hypothetical protein